MLVRLIHYQVKKEDDGRRADRFLKNRLYSHSDLAALKSTDGALLRNGSQLRLLDELHAGDEIRISVYEEESSAGIVPVELPLSVLYEDEDLIVLNKPAGMPTHSTYSNTENSLASALAFYYRKQSRPFVFRCSNRLDMDTSGVIPVAKHKISSSILATMSERRLIGRTYLALVSGNVRCEEGTVDLPIGRKSEHTTEQMVDLQEGKRAVTHYRVIASGENSSLLELRLETGRTHQIRVHMAAIGHPLLGDRLYNPEQGELPRQALHSACMRFRHPITGEELCFTAPLPEDIRRGIGKLPDYLL
ncbi:MAG: RluA family pseudouridine synthase [Lachnospiraceae bacterium]|nr:RluA family pseudouridine synthase [Lachnospiraceae bacterium]